MPNKKTTVGAGAGSPTATFFEGATARKPINNWYTRFAKRASGMFKAKNEFTKEEYKIALEFLDWDVQPKDVNAAPMLALVISLLLAIPVLGFLIYMVFITRELSFTWFAYGAMPLLIIPFYMLFYFQTFILKAANSQKIKAITFIPEIVNYMIMSMKLTPNLERAVRFASEHGRGKIAEDLQKAIWSVDIGTYPSIEEALDNLAYTWGKYSEEFKHGLMVIRGSVIEADDAKRAAILDKAMRDILESIRDSMDKYAVQMRQPSIYLYYVGVLLPLMLIIMLPIGSVMAQLPLAQTWVMILLYNILIPLGTILFANTILNKRPPVYIPPKIPDNYPGLPKRGYIKIGNTSIPAIILGLLLGAFVFGLSVIVVEPLVNPLPEEFEEEALAAYFPFWTIAGGVIAFSLVISTYLYGTAYGKRKAQLDLIQMENEFQDSIYILASRLGENRPIEEALTYSADFLSETKIGGLYRKTSENVQTLGMTVDMAFFDPVYGSLKNVPSDLIRGSLQIVVDSIALGVEQGARALLSLSMQLRDSQKIKEKIASLLEEITSMMKSIAFMIAPLVLGITSALQNIVIGALRSVGSATPSGAADSASIPGLGGGASLPFAGLGDTSTLELIPDNLTFLLIIALYVIEVTILLVYFTSKIEEGDNDLAVKMNIATSLPTALILFFGSAWVAKGLTGI
ncbi:MAG: type II secretion system F family protein [DPANN group archaeon]|nr:type II secretion system F family protein [DPANN group archaeon]